MLACLLACLLPPYELRNPQNHCAHVVRWADDAEDPAQVQQRQQMAQFLGAKKQKVDRHSLFASAMLEPVEAW